MAKGRRTLAKRSLFLTVNSRFGSPTARRRVLQLPDKRALPGQERTVDANGQFVDNCRVDLSIVALTTRAKHDRDLQGWTP